LQRIIFVENLNNIFAKDLTRFGAHKISANNYNQEK